MGWTPSGGPTMPRAAVDMECDAILLPKVRQPLPIWTRWPEINRLTSALGDDGNARRYAERRRDRAQFEIAVAW